MKYSFALALAFLLVVIGTGCVDQTHEIHGDMGVGTQSRNTSWVPDSRPNP